MQEFSARLCTSCGLLQVYLLNTSINGIPKDGILPHTDPAQVTCLCKINPFIMNCTISGVVATASLLHHCTVSLQVLIPAPFWVSYPEMAKLAGAKPVIIDCPADSNFLLTPAALQANLGPASRLLILCSPSNPTGSVYSRSAVPAELLLGST